METDKITLQVLVAHNHYKIQYDPVREYGHKGDTYIEGKLDTEYRLRVSNSFGHRVLVVPSIDGINPLNGKPSVDNNEGYIVAAYGSIVIDGWRTSLSEVAKFIFNKKTQSYTAKIGNGTANCGVIGIKVFGEKIPEPKIVNHYYTSYNNPYVYPYYPFGTHIRTLPNTFDTDTYTFTCSTGNNNINANSVSLMGLSHSQAATPRSTTFSGSLNNTSCLRSMNTSSSVENSEIERGIQKICDWSNGGKVVIDETPYQLGTGWGDKTESKVTQTTFDKGDLLSTLEIFYADRNGLEALGVDLSKKARVAFIKPQAFGGFCKDPNN